MSEKGVRLDLFEQVFFAKFSQFVNQLEFYVEHIKQNIRNDETLNPVDEKAILTSTIEKVEVSIKKVQKGFIAEIYTENEAQKEIQRLKAQKEYLEEQVKKLDSYTKIEKIDQLQAVVYKLRQLLEGTSDLETKEINHLLTSLIDRIEYKRIGNHKTEIDMLIYYKEQTGGQVI